MNCLRDSWDLLMSTPKYSNLDAPPGAEDPDPHGGFQGHERIRTQLAAAQFVCGIYQEHPKDILWLTY